MHRVRVLALAISLVPCAAAAADLRPFFDLEAGALWTSRNDIGVPGDSGTRFDAAGGEFDTQTAPAVRLQAGLRLGRHRLAATFAPVRLRGDGAGAAAIQFRGRTFTPEDSSIRYRFDSYRLTYRYALVDRPSFDLQLGATAFVRDAEIRLSQAGQATAEKNVGLVPLVSFRASWRFAHPVRLTLDGDALAAPQGRAEDVLLALELETGELTFRVGYRVVEGGVDNDTVYNFAWLNQVVAGVRYDL